MQKSVFLFNLNVAVIHSSDKNESINQFEVFRTDWSFKHIGYLKSYLRTGKSEFAFW